MTLKYKEITKIFLALVIIILITLVLSSCRETFLEIDGYTLKPYDNNTVSIVDMDKELKNKKIIDIPERIGEYTVVEVGYVKRFLIGSDIPLSFLMTRKISFPITVNTINVCLFNIGVIEIKGNIENIVLVAVKD